MKKKTRYKNWAVLFFNICNFGETSVAEIVCQVVAGPYITMHARLNSCTNMIYYLATNHVRTDSTVTD